MESPYYYFILFAILLSTFGFVSIFYQALQTSNVDSIPYISLISFAIATIIFLFISFIRKYPVHLIFYVVSLVCIVGILNIKRNMEKH
jgi:hypothetical protein